MDWDWQPMKKFSTAVFFFLMNSALGANLILKTKAAPVTSSTPSSIPTVVASPTTTLKLSPRARIETQAPVTSTTFIPQSFFSLRSQLLFLSPIDVILAPSISAIQAGLALGGVHQSVFVAGKLHQQSTFDVVRNWQKIIDPISGQLLGIVGKRIGKVELVLAADSKNAFHEFIVTQAWSELSAGDLLLPTANNERSNPVFDNHTTQVQAASGRVATLMREGIWVGTLDVVAINLGSQQGMHPGATLSVLKQAKMNHPSALTIPSQPVMQTIATLFVFDVNELAAFAVVTQANDVISVGDSVVSIRTPSK
jgi:hypothetical protein